MFGSFVINVLPPLIFKDLQIMRNQYNQLFWVMCDCLLPPLMFKALRIP